MTMPLPPMTNNRRPKQESINDPDPEPIGLAACCPPPLPPKTPAALTEDETSFILRTQLLPHHRDDPNVLRFIQSYMACRDARQAAREAGITPRSGVNLRSRPDIHKTIEALTTKSMMKYGFDAHEVIEKVKEIANIDPADIFNPDGTCKTDIHSIPPESRRAIKKFKVKNLYENDINGVRTCIGQLVEVELWDKMKASEMLGREEGLFKETRKVEHDVTSNMASLLLESNKRATDRVERMIDVTPRIMGKVSNTTEVKDGKKEES